jgi:hypothetical protein
VEKKLIYSFQIVGLNNFTRLKAINLWNIGEQRKQALLVSQLNALNGNGSSLGGLGALMMQRGYSGLGGLEQQAHSGALPTASVDSFGFGLGFGMGGALSRGFIPNADLAQQSLLLGQSQLGLRKAAISPEQLAMREGGVEHTGGKGTFPQKLHQMLSDLEKEEGGKDIASFLPHWRAFSIHNPKEFVEKIMPKYFRMSRFSSFQRQLNLYEFQRITDGPDKGAYFHELFLHGRPMLCTQIKRNKRKCAAAAAIPNQFPLSPGVGVFAMPGVNNGAAQADVKPTTADFNSLSGRSGGST